VPRRVQRLKVIAFFAEGLLQGRPAAEDGGATDRAAHPKRMRDADRSCRILAARATGRPQRCQGGRVTVAVTPEVSGSLEPHARGAVAGTRAGLAREDAAAVDGAVAALAVAAGLSRYLADVAARTGRRAFALLPSVGPGSVLLRMLRGPVPPALAHPASAAAAAVAAVADRWVPELTRAVLARLDVPALVREYVSVDELAAMLDVDAVVARVDLDAAVRRVDLDAVASRLDLDAVLDRVDLDAVAGRLDLEALVARLDLDRIVDKVDISRVVDRVDLDAIVDRVDLDRAVERVDLDRAVERVDLDRAVDRVDVDRIIARADITGLAWYVVREIDLPGLLRASSGSVTTEMVRSVRDQGIDADRAVERIVDRLLHRQGRRTTVSGRDPGTGT
jgi:hypothetical protein